LTEKTTTGKPVNFNALPARNYTEYRQVLIEAFCSVRGQTEKIASPFSPEDQQLQSMTDASPVKWHLAHGSWFFETFILAEFASRFEWFDEHFCYLFNSYYNALGQQFPRAQRGLMSRPGLERVMQYRKQVTAHVLDLLRDCDDGLFGKLAASLVLGLNHEQQHQELIMTDISHALLYRDGEQGPPVSGQSIRLNSSEGKSAADGWLDFAGGEAITGYQGQGFCFDNELAAHPELLQPFQIASHPVSNADWIEFMDAGGYDDPLLWLSDGWAWKTKNSIRCPLYWRRVDGNWRHNTLAGPEAETSDRAVSHVSYYEADAFASWKKARLPREGEWELAARSHAWETNHEPGRKPDNIRRPGQSIHELAFHDLALHDPGQCWEWTQSAYCAYPRFQVSPGMAAEYNGKFMVNQMVLKGASRATASFHSRASYRNFFYPDARWQFTSLRLARDAG